MLGWAGMRGVVTLAAAFAIPDTKAFTYRETLILTALVVAAGTLFVQGSTLPWLVRRLRLPAPDPREDALARAALFEKATAAGLERLEEHIGDEDPFDTVGALRARAAQRNTAAWERLGGTSSYEETPSEAYSRLRLEMLDAERAKVLHVRGTGKIPHEVVEDVLTALDIEESMLDIRTERLAELENAQTVSGIAGTIAPCDHLEAAPRDVESAVEGECEDCVRDGAGGLLLGRAQLLVRGRGWMNHQTAHIAHIRQMREDFQVVDELLAGFVTALNSEREHGAGAFRRVFLGQLDNTGWRAAMDISPSSHGRCFSRCCATASVFGKVPVHAQAQRFDALQETGTN